MLTADQVHDIHSGRALLASVPAMRQLIADKAYDANDLRDFLARQGTEPVISSTPRRLIRPAFDTAAYRARNLIERTFCRLEILACDYRTLRQNRLQLSRRYLPGHRRHGLASMSPRPSTTLADLWGPTSFWDSSERARVIHRRSAQGGPTNGRGLTG